MLLALHLRNFVIVDQLALDFSPGFSVLTGETGAGKSILIDALSLALGARGESGMVRPGSEKAEISAEFDIRALTGLRAWLEAQAVPDEDGICLMRRILYADGRSRAFINGVAATMQQLRDAGAWLVDIYSQHAHHSLLSGATQRAVLDDYAQAGDLVLQVAHAYRDWYALQQRRLAAEANAEANAEQLAALRDQVRELSVLNISAEGWETLQAEHARLANAAGLIANAEASYDLVAEGESALLRQINVLRQRLAEMQSYDPAVHEAVEAAENAAIQLEEIDRYLKRYLNRAELEPERLYAVESRMQEIHDTARKYRVRAEALPTLLAEATSRQAALEALADDGALARETAQALTRYQNLARQLSALRQAAAQQLGTAVAAEMQRLALGGGSFEVCLLPQADPAPHGLEQVEFLVAGHAGVVPRPLAKVASGGELSRISLAIRVVTAARGEMPTMIFDEVDVGIGGGVAEVVGQLLATLGAGRQVLVITHLPQVAAQGRQHLRVSKLTQNGETLSRIEKLSPEARVGEIARMLGGVEITETTRQHAQEMLTAALR